MKNFKPNGNFIYFLYWVTERMNIFWKRYNNIEPPYTNDEVLQNYKFTNVYRCLDRVSQYFIKEIINKSEGYSDKDLFWRILLFKHFNKIETWGYLEKRFGEITLDIPMESMVGELGKLNEVGGAVYSSAFLQTAPFMGSEGFLSQYGLQKGCRKFRAYLTIFYKYFIEQGNIDNILAVESLEELFGSLKKVPGFAAFLSMQYTTDLNWSRLFNFNENSFISASVGSIRGIERVFDFEGKVKDYSAVIYWVHENFSELFEYYTEEFDINLNFKPLEIGGKVYMPTLMDIQNCFCESDKYMRGLGVETKGKKVYGKRIKSKFNQNNFKIKYEFPKKWLK